MNYGFRTLLVTSFWLLLLDYRCTSDNESPKTGRLYSCLQNCANCVQFWEYGLYNGRRCANRCLRQQGREIVDPDCNDPKMFNYGTRIIEQLLEMRQMQADTSTDTHENMLMADAPAPEVRGKRQNRLGKRPHRKANVEIEDVDDDGRPAEPREDSFSERFQVEVKAQHLRRRKHNRKRNPSKSHDMDRRAPRTQSREFGKAGKRLKAKERRLL